MARLPILVTVLALVACAEPPPQSVLTPACQPFADIDWSQASKDDKQVLSEAAEDFCAVLARQKPVHARPRPGFDAPSDGGSRFYIGRRYRLTALQSASSFGGVAGTAYGPILRFDKDFAPGNTSEISQIRVVGIPSPPSE